MTLDKLTFDEAMKLARMVNNWKRDQNYRDYRFHGEVGNSAALKVVMTGSESYHDITLTEKMDEVEIFSHGYPSQVPEYAKLHDLYSNVQSAWQKAEAEKRQNEIERALNAARALLRREGK